MNCGSCEIIWHWLVLWILLEEFVNEFVNPIRGSLSGLARNRVRWPVKQPRQAAPYGGHGLRMLPTQESDPVIKLYLNYAVLTSDQGATVGIYVCDRDRHDKSSLRVLIDSNP